jgi:hypothetical protein
MNMSTGLLLTAGAFTIIGVVRYWLDWEHGGLCALIVIGCLMGSCTAVTGPMLGW